MADTSLGWGIEGVISTEESVSAMLKVISTKTHKDSGKFWTWEGKVRASECHFQAQPPGLTHTGAPVVRTNGQDYNKHDSVENRWLRKNSLAKIFIRLDYTIYEIITEKT